MSLNLQQKVELLTERVDQLEAEREAEKEERAAQRRSNRNQLDAVRTRVSRLESVEPEFRRLVGVGYTHGTKITMPKEPQRLRERREHEKMTAKELHEPDDSEARDGGGNGLPGRRD